MIINCKQTIKNLKGEDMKEPDGEVFTLGKSLGIIVTNAKEGGKMKLFLLGTKLYQQDTVEVDEADLTLLKNVVKSTEAYGALIAGQCEMLLEEVKKEVKD